MRLFNRLFFKELWLVLVPGLISITLTAFMLVVVIFVLTPQSSQTIPTNIMNPTSAEDWMKKCQAVFINQGGEALDILGKERATFIDKKLYNQLYQQAIADCNRAVQLDPQLAAGYLQRGTVKSFLGHTEAAIADYQKAQALLREKGKILEVQGVERMINNAVRPQYRSTTMICC